MASGTTKLDANRHVGKLTRDLKVLKRRTRQSASFESSGGFGPGDPTSVDFTSQNVQDGPQGITTATLTVTWFAPALDANGDVFTATIVYSVQWQYAGDANWKSGGHTSDTILDIPGVRTDANVQVRVRAAFPDGTVSNWVASPIRATASDLTSPVTPATPILASIIAGLRVTWNGKDAGGGNEPSDFDRTEVWYNTSASTAGATLWTTIKSPSGGAVTITNLSYGVSYWVFLISVDQSGNRSNPSALAGPNQILHVNGSVGGDITSLAADIITAGTLSAAFITLSGRLTTAFGGTQSGARVEFDGSGLRVYDSSSTGFSTGKLFDLSPGSVTLLGTMSVTGTLSVTGAITLSGSFTMNSGSIFRTSTSNPHIEISTTHGYASILFVGGSGTGSFVGTNGTGLQVTGAVGLIIDGGQGNVNVNGLGGVTIGGDGGGITFMDAVISTLNAVGEVLIHGSTSAPFVIDNLQAGGATGNMFIGSAGTVAKITSSRRYKKDIVPITAPYDLLALEPVTFQYDPDKVEMADELCGITHLGFVAEQALEVGLDKLVLFDAEGQPDGFAYDRVPVMLLGVVRDLVDRVGRLEESAHA
jgi:hypothetical protein